MFPTCATGVVSISRCTATGERVDSILTGSSVLTRVWGTVVDVWGCVVILKMTFSHIFSKLGDFPFPPSASH